MHASAPRKRDAAALEHVGEGCAWKDGHAAEASNTFYYKPRTPFGATCQEKESPSSKSPGRTLKRTRIDAPVKSAKPGWGCQPSDVLPPVIPVSVVPGCVAFDGLSGCTDISGMSEIDVSQDHVLRDPGDSESTSVPSLYFPAQSQGRYDAELIGVPPLSPGSLAGLLRPPKPYTGFPTWSEEESDDEEDSDGTDNSDKESDDGMDVLNSLIAGTFMTIPRK